MTDAGVKSPAQQDIKSERRAFHRALLQISGCLSYGTRKVDCVVLDLSLGGAMIKVDAGVFVEEGTEDADAESLLRLELAAPAVLLVRIAWRKDTVLGLKFLADPYDVSTGLENLLPRECFKRVADRELPLLST